MRLYKRQGLRKWSWCWRSKGRMWLWPGWGRILWVMKGWDVKWFDMCLLWFCEDKWNKNISSILSFFPSFSLEIDFTSWVNPMPAFWEPVRLQRWKDRSRFCLTWHWRAWTTHQFRLRTPWQAGTILTLRRIYRFYFRQQPKLNKSRFTDVFGSVFLQLLDPAFHDIEWSHWSNVIDTESNLCLSVVDRSNRLVFFLSCCVPNLSWYYDNAYVKFDCSSIVGHGIAFGNEGRAHGWLCEFIKLVMGKSG